MKIIKECINWFLEVHGSDPINHPRDSVINLMMLMFTVFTLMIQIGFIFTFFIDGTINAGLFLNFATLSIYGLYFYWYKKGKRILAFSVMLGYFIFVLVRGEYMYNILENAFFAYLVIALAALFFNSKTSFGVMVLYVASHYGFIYAEAEGFIPPFQTLEGHETILYATMFTSALLIIFLNGLYTSRLRDSVRVGLDRKRELEEQRENLEDMVIERTRHLLEVNAQLEASKNEVQRLHSKLEKKFDAKNSELEEAKKEVEKVDYISGIAEITSGTLHNVKNIINSINVGIELSKRFYSSDAVKALKKASTMLRDNINNIEDFIVHDTRGKKLLEYYLAIEELMDEELERNKGYLESLETNVDSINSIITTQQVYVSGKEDDAVFIHEIADDALQILATSVDALKVTIDKRYDLTPKILVHKVKLVHVMVNIIKNAIEATIGEPDGRREIYLSTFTRESFVRIEIRDTGKGATSDQVDQLFNSGFTTKDDGHGFGLSTSKRYLNEMNAEILAQSAGLGTGMKFTITFDLKQDSESEPST